VPANPAARRPVDHDEAWREFAAFPVFWQGPYNTMPRPMDAIRNQESVTCDAIPGVTFL